MASTDKAKAAQAKKRAASKKQADADAVVAGRELDDARVLREAGAASEINRPLKVKPDAAGNIDQRMAALLKDHQDMGARPK